MALLKECHVRVLRRAYRHPQMRRVSSREVIALAYTLFNARDSVSDLIAYDKFLEEWRSIEKQPDVLVLNKRR